MRSGYYTVTKTLIGLSSQSNVTLLQLRSRLLLASHVLTGLQDAVHRFKSSRDTSKRQFRLAFLDRES